MSNFFFSCKGCTDRTPGCHSSCEKYLTEKAEYDALKKTFAEKDRVGQGLQDQKFRVVQKACKRKGRKINRVRY